MSQLYDQRYLKEQQYKTPGNLQARIELHRRFGTNPYGWTRWVFDQIQFPEKEILLEVGCGPGSLWAENSKRIPSNQRMILGDFSTGMVHRSQAALKDHEGFSFVVLDVQEIPTEERRFDLAIANHMLYHVPDLDRGVKELARVIKPGETLYAATNGFNHMHELHQLIQDYYPEYKGFDDQPRRFALENAPGILESAFENVSIRRYVEDLLVTEAQPLVDYIFSMWGIFTEGKEEERAAFEAYIRQRFDQRGYFRISKSQGLVIARKPAEAG